MLEVCNPLTFCTAKFCDLNSIDYPEGGGMSSKINDSFWPKTKQLGLGLLQPITV